VNNKESKNQLVEYCNGLGYVVTEGGSDYPNLNICIKHNERVDGYVWLPTQIEVWYGRDGRYKYRDYRYDVYDRKKNGELMSGRSEVVSFDEIKDVIENGGGGIRWSWSSENGFQNNNWKMKLEECLELGKEFLNNNPQYVGVKDEEKEEVV